MTPDAAGDRHRGALVAQSIALVLLLAATWLVVGASLEGTGAAVVSAGRTGFTVLGLFALTALLSVRGDGPHGGAAPARPYRWWQLALLAGTGVTAYTVASTVAIELAGPVLPTLVLALTPAVVLAAESAIARRRPAATALAGTALAVAGAVLYVLPRLGGTLGRDVALGTLSALAAMLSMAFYGVYFGRVNRGHRGAMAPRILPVFAVGTMPLAVWAAVALARGESVSVASIGLLAGLGIIIYVPVYLLQHRIIVTAGASYAALLGLATPPLVGVSSALLRLAPVPAPLQVAGIALTVLGMAVVLTRGRRRASAPAAEDPMPGRTA